MRILIIGGTGLISSAITQELLHRGGHEIVHYNRGKRSTTPTEVTTITGDRTDFDTFEKQMADAGRFDCVMDMIGFQVADAESALRAFGNGRCGHYIFCSTVDVYDKPFHYLPVTEDHPLKGTNSYGANKAAMEEYFFAAHARGELNVTTIRPGHTYNDHGALIHSFGWGTSYLDRLRRGKPIIVHGDGSSLWTLAHASDVARAFVNAAGNPVAFGKAYNTTGEELLTWDMLYQKTAQIMGWPEPTLVHIPTDLLQKVAPKKSASVADNFQFNNIMDNSRARTDLDYRYTVRFEDAVRRIVPNLQASKQIQDSDDVALSWYDAILDAWAQHGSAMAQSLNSRFPDDL